jgi:hypothetical protein
LGITFLYLLRNVKEYLISTMNKKVITRGDSNAVMLLTGINDLKFSKKKPNISGGITPIPLPWIWHGSTVGHWSPDP